MSIFEGSWNAKKRKKWECFEWGREEEEILHSVRLTLWEFNLKILHCINDWNDGYQLYHSSRFFPFFIFFSSSFSNFLIQITQGNMRFYSIMPHKEDDVEDVDWEKRRWKNCILAPPDICLSSETIKYVLIVMRGFFFLFFTSFSSYEFA